MKKMVEELREFLNNKEVEELEFIFSSLEKAKKEKIINNIINNVIYNEYNNSSDVYNASDEWEKINEVM